MRIQPLSGLATLRDDSRHLALQLVELNSQIARLAIALGVDLDNPQQAQALLKDPPPSPPEHYPAGAGHLPDWPSTPDRRVAHKYTELRGLVLMRYSLELHAVEVLGAATSLAMMQVVVAELEREGFAHGAAGMQLHVLAMAAGH